VVISGGSSMPKGEIPNVPGLQTVAQGQSSSIRIDNGTTTMDFTFKFQMRATKVGNYTIPSYSVLENGKSVVVPAATLEVTDNPAHPATPAISGNLITLNASVQRNDIYVGEKLPIDITLTFRPDLQPQISGEFTQSSDDFERIDISGKPRQYGVPVNGQRFEAATWQSALSPIRTGNETLQFTLPIQVTLPGTSSTDMTSVLMGNFPNVFGQQESLSVLSAPLNLNILPLPDDGKPANFSGGIGNFTISQPSLDTTDLQVGVPVTLKFTVSGQGNFDRLQAPKLDLGTAWRSYAPKDTFKGEDSINYRGEKTFEYVVMPLQENITEMPALPFSYFNPETKAYVEMPTKPISITVKPAPPGQAPTPLPTVAASSSQQNKSELINLHIDSGGWLPAQPRMLLDSPLFWAGQVAPAVILAGFIITRCRQLRLENDPAFARKLRSRQLAATALARARAAAQNGDAALFHAEAQRALQEAATHDRLDAAEALTWQEFDAHLVKQGIASDMRQQAREIFDVGDAMRFGGLTPDKADLNAAAGRLEKLVTHFLERA